MARKQPTPERIILAVCNQKGGTGKTTTTLGLASSASAAGIRTLVIDMDPQCNVTNNLGIDEPEYTTNDVLHADAQGAAVAAITPSTWPHVDIIASELGLADRDADTKLGVEFRLQKALDDEALNEYQLILIDCQPSIGRLVSNALIAATAVLVVTQPAVNASQGVANILETIGRVQSLYNAELNLAGVVMNQVPPRGREANFRINEARAALGDQLWEPMIPHRTVITEAQGAREPIHSYGSRATDLIALFDNYLSRLGFGAEVAAANTAQRPEPVGAGK